VAYNLTLAKAEIENWDVPSLKTISRRMNKEGIKLRSIYDDI